MRWLLALGLAGCHVGAGPVIGLSKRGHLRLGGELGGGAGPAVATLGATMSPSSEPSRGYITLDAGYGQQIGERSNKLETWFAGGATVGYAWGDQLVDHVAFGLWAVPFMFEDQCGSAELVFSAAIGVRDLGGIAELFLAPKVSVLETPCIRYH